MRRLAATAALLMLALPGAARAGARPSPYAAEFRTATTTFELGGRDGRTWLVGLTYDELRPAGGAVGRSLTLSLRPCTSDAQRHVRCGAESVYRTVVTDGAIAADLGTAYVRAGIAGAPVDVAWSVNASATDTLATVSPEQVVARRAYAGGNGPADGVVLGPRCHATGSV